MATTTDRQLATRGNGRFATVNQPQAPALFSETDLLLMDLPAWLRLLVGAFPKAETNKFTYEAYQELFAGEDQERMLEAVKTAVKTHRFHTFPTIGEITKALQDTQWAEFKSEEFINRQPLSLIAMRRKQLLDQMYAGEMNLPVWWKLIDDCQRFGYLSNAVSLKARLVRWFNGAEAVTE